jgi:2-acylglycerol O-acyltransferase 2
MSASEMIEHVPNVRWAPLTGIPFERRLQTAAVLVWVFLLGNCLTLFFTSLFFPVLWPLHIAYFIYCWFDHSPEKGGRRSDWFRSLPFWRYFAGYFPVKLVKVKDIQELYIKLKQRNFRKRI